MYVSSNRHTLTILLGVVPFLVVRLIRSSISILSTLLELLSVRI